MAAANPRARPSVPAEVQVRVFFRDGWLCRWCHRPVVFAPTFRLIQLLVKESGFAKEVAYFHPNWSRHSAPLLDHLGAVVDHVEAYSKGGRHDESNFVTACNKCNARKNAKKAGDYALEKPGKPVRGKYGEPRHWDGLVSLFLLLAAKAELTSTERRWKAALRAATTQVPTS